jgi:VIT1/CCC1 family predicted Fe2+/Mn2+ transporter
MNDKEPVEKLADMHTHEAIAARIASSTNHSYVGDFVLGAVDGVVTTFAIVAGVAGAGLGAGVAIVLGIANMLADGLSMGAGNFLKAKADARVVDRYRRMEEMHIDNAPEGEREEIRQIFAAKGFEGELLESAVDVITKDRRRWVDTMLTDEWGLQLNLPSPLRSGWTTFLAFVLAGSLPLLPLLLVSTFTPTQTFAASAILTVITFLVIGAIQGIVTEFPPIRSAIYTLAIGGSAALVAYLIGAALKDLIGR